MDEASYNKLIEKGLNILSNLKFSSLLYNDEIMANPYSLIHPGYLYYIWGKISNSDDKFKYAFEVFDKLIKDALNTQNYLEAGEFSILKLKTIGRMIEKSKILKKVYNTTLKIFVSLSDLYTDPFYLDSIIEIEKLYEKYSNIKTNIKKIENLYRNVAKRYFNEAESIEAKDLINIKIMDYFQAAYYLNKITDTINDDEKIEKENILNKIIFEISNQLELFKKNKIKLKEYTQRNLKVNLNYGLGRTYSLYNKVKERKLFFQKALRLLDKIFDDSSLIPSLLKGKKVLYKDNDIYRIQNLEIFSEDFFEKVICTREKIELLELKKRIVNDFEYLEENNEKSIENELINLLMDLYEQLILSFENELSSENLKNKKADLIRCKYLGFCVYLIYQIFKLRTSSKKNKKPK